VEALEKYGHDAVLVGFTTHHGTVTAASDWGKPAERKRVRPAVAGSYEALFHAAQRVRFLLVWNEGDTVAERLRARRLERAIGVIYRPDRTSSTPCSISMRRGQSNRSKPRLNGKRERCRRPSRSRCNRGSTAVTADEAAVARGEQRRRAASEPGLGAVAGVVGI